MSYSGHSGSRGGDGLHSTLNTRLPALDCLVGGPKVVRSSMEVSLYSGLCLEHVEEACMTVSSTTASIPAGPTGVVMMEPPRDTRCIACGAQRLPGYVRAQPQTGSRTAAMSITHPVIRDSRRLEAEGVQNGVKMPASPRRCAARCAPRCCGDYRSVTK